MKPPDAKSRIAPKNILLATDFTPQFTELQTIALNWR